MRKTRLVQSSGSGNVGAMRTVICFCLGAFLAAAAPCLAGPTNNTAAIAAVFQADRELTGIPLSTVIEATTGHKIIPIDLQREVDRELIRKLGVALDEVLAR